MTCEESVVIIFPLELVCVPLQLVCDKLSYQYQAIHKWELVEWSSWQWSVEEHITMRKTTCWAWEDKFKSRFKDGIECIWSCYKSTSLNFKLNILNFIPDLTINFVWCIKSRPLHQQVHHFLNWHSSSFQSVTITELTLNMPQYFSTRMWLVITITPAKFQNPAMLNWIWKAIGEEKWLNVCRDEFHDSADELHEAERSVKSFYTLFMSCGDGGWPPSICKMRYSANDTVNRSTTISSCMSHTSAKDAAKL